VRECSMISLIAAHRIHFFYFGWVPFALSRRVPFALSRRVPFALSRRVPFALTLPLNLGAIEKQSGFARIKQSTTTDRHLETSSPIWRAPNWHKAFLKMICMLGEFVLGQMTHLLPRGNVLHAFGVDDVESNWESNS
jgi:hypothetical protein